MFIDKTKATYLEHPCNYNPQLSVDVVTISRLLLELKFLHLFLFNNYIRVSLLQFIKCIQITFLFDLCNFNISFKAVAMNLP